ncbi:MAG: hypothetical protein IJ080_01100 [Oscillospiraceae bacterium]|nr:hypothetical protein [Oscillospiraceae bacterium]MBQ8978341.1 hypothetical protein [Oscillospiraceae bacterium]
MLVLICRETLGDGSLVFNVYDTDKRINTRYTNAELTPLVVSKKVKNAKLENSVIKITDSNRSLITLTHEAGMADSVYYVFEDYTSPVGSHMLALVSNRGRVVEFSESMAREFFEAHRVVNAYIGHKGLHLINVPTFTSALSKSLKHVNNH